LTTVNSTRIGFNICPRLNAAGRMGNPRPAFDLLLETDATRAFELATELDSINRVRQAETESVIAAVIDRFEADSEKIESPLLVQSSEGWRTGILGLAAGKLVERLCRPVILLREEGDIATGSCRSVPGLHIVDLLRRHDQLLDRYGGHRQAAGLTMPRENVSLLRNALMADPVIAAMDLPFSPELVVDAVLEPQMVNFETARTIMQLSPYGVGNPEPLFVLPGVSLLRSETMGQDRTHLRLVWRGTHGVITAPFFGAAERAGEAVAGSKIDIACHLAIDRWNGRPRLDVRVVDFRRST